MKGTQHEHPTPETDISESTSRRNLAIQTTVSILVGILLVAITIAVVTNQFGATSSAQIEAEEERLEILEEIEEERQERLEDARD